MKVKGFLKKVFAGRVGGGRIKCEFFGQDYGINKDFLGEVEKEWLGLLNLPEYDRMVKETCTTDEGMSDFNKDHSI